MRYEPTHHTIVGMDVAGSGSLDDRRQLRMRADLRAIVDEVLARQRIPSTAVDRGDLGDGSRLVVSAEVSPRELLDPFVPHLAGALRAHREFVSDAGRLRLRVAVHVGLLHRDETGWAGQPLVHCARLLEAGPVRRALAETPHADLVLVVSEAMYNDVVRHGYGLDPAGYRRVTITEKETTTPAWIHVRPTAAEPDPIRPSAPPAATPLATPADGTPAKPSLSQLAPVVEALLDIPEFAAPQTREEILAQLRREVAAAIRRYPAARVEAYSVVRTCLSYSGGLTELVEAIRAFTGGPYAMTRLDDAVAGLLGTGFGGETP